MNREEIRDEMKNKYEREEEKWLKNVNREFSEKEQKWEKKVFKFNLWVKFRISLPAV